MRGGLLGRPGDLGVVTDGRGLRGAVRGIPAVGAGEAARGRAGDEDAREHQGQGGAAADAAVPTERVTT